MKQIFSLGFVSFSLKFIIFTCRYFNNGKGEISNRRQELHTVVYQLPNGPHDFAYLNYKYIGTVCQLSTWHSFCVAN